MYERIYSDLNNLNFQQDQLRRQLQEVCGINRAISTLLEAVVRKSDTMQITLDRQVTRLVELLQAWPSEAAPAAGIDTSDGSQQTSTGRWEKSKLPAGTAVPLAAALSGDPATTQDSAPAVRSRRSKTRRRTGLASLTTTGPAAPKKRGRKKKAAAKRGRPRKTVTTNGTGRLSI